MNPLFIILQQATQQGAPAGGGSWSMWIMLIAIFAVMWLFMIRPQRKQQKELQEFRSGLKKGDKVVTVGGIYGEIVEVDDRTAIIRVDHDVKIKVDKQGLVKDYSSTQQQ
ncbi:MAG: preprotein translocase subunit YajC [Bacteroidales bacterium]|jgi:preprotein translocase subunit YajC|nr:preprotein translocase subunit YajC [Bacteroidales bacterium]